MGKDHKENILKCLKQWHDVTLKQHEALAGNDLSLFERLNRVSVVLQSRFGNSLSMLKTDVLDKESLTLLREIQKCQAGFIKEMNEKKQDLALAIGKLRKNRTSINGYRQKSPALPRFKSERT